MNQIDKLTCFIFLKHLQIWGYGSRPVADLMSGMGIGVEDFVRCVCWVSFWNFCCKISSTQRSKFYWIPTMGLKFDPSWPGWPGCAASGACRVCKNEAKTRKNKEKQDMNDNPDLHIGCWFHIDFHYVDWKRFSQEFTSIPQRGRMSVTQTFQIEIHAIATV